MDNKYYVYIYLDPRKPGKYVYGEFEFDGGEPFYVGKGYGRRCFDHLKLSSLKRCRNNYKKFKIEHIQSNGTNPIIIKVAEKLYEIDSFELEKKLIQTIGRADLGKGLLTNLTDGGDGPAGAVYTEERKKQIGQKSKLYWDGLSEEDKKELCKTRKGRIVSDEGRKNISEGKKGEKNPNFGRCFTEEERRKRGDARRGKHHSKETCRKIGEANRRRIVTDETKEKIRQARLGKSSYNKGKHLSEEHKRKLSESKKGKPNIWQKGRPLSEETKRKLSESKKGKKGHVPWNKGKFTIPVIEMFESVNSLDYIEVLELIPNY